MPSWDEVRSRAGPRPADQRVDVIQALGEPHPLVLCEAVAADKRPAGELLAHNMSLAVGAVAPSGELYVIRHAQPRAEVDLNRLTRTLEPTAHEAARLRARVAPLAGALQAQPPVSPVFPSD